MALFFAFSVVLPATGMPAVAAMAIMLLLVASALWRVRSWSARAGWNERHLLSIAIGVVLYFTFIWGPLVEFILHLPARTGMTAVNLLIVVALLIFDKRVKRRLARQAQDEVTPLPTGFAASVAQPASPASSLTAYTAHGQRAGDRWRFVTKDGTGGEAPGQHRRARGERDGP
jgi:hypothetical protein